MQEFAIKPKTSLNHSEQFAKIKELCQIFLLTNDQLLDIKKSILSEIQKGLKQNTNKNASIKCCPTFVQEFPCSCEHGKFLVLKIGERKLHISHMHLKAAPNYDFEKETFEIPQDLYSGSINSFFDHLADRVNKFLRQYDLSKDHLLIAICIKSNDLLNIKQKFNLENFTQKDCLESLQNALESLKGLHFTLETILCNSIAILLANSWDGDYCKIGINIGNGCNAVYVEQVNEIETVTEQTHFDQMIVNTEWGEFGVNGELDSIITEFDKQVDAVSSNKGKRIFEKLTSGFYLAELARQIFLKCIKDGILFEGHTSATLQKPFSFTNHYLNAMLTEDEGTYDHMPLIFDRLGISKPNENECCKVRFILETITQRSAHLVASGILSLMEKISDEHAFIALGGCFYFSCRIYHSALEEKLKELVDQKYTFELKFMKNDVAIGSAILTAINNSKEFVFESEEMRKLLQEIVGK